MIFKDIEITNYGIFKGRHKVSFAEPSIQSVTLIGGLNGSGKTTIFEAIQIAMFGIQSNLHKENKQPSYTKYLKGKINRDCDEAEGTAIKFTINIADDIDLEEDITVIRSWKNTTKGLKECFEVHRNDMIDIDLSDNWIEFISQIISPSLSKLFLFDGEKILHYADPQNTSALLIQGIQTLFGADLINDLEDDLKILKKRIIKSFDPEAGSGLEELDKEISQLRKTITSTKKNIEKKKDALEILNKEFSILENKFDAYGLKKINKAKVLEFDLQKLTMQSEELLKQQRAIVSGSMPLSLVQNRLNAISLSSEGSDEIKDYEKKISAFKERDRDILKRIKETKNEEIYKELKTYLGSSIKVLKSDKPEINLSNFISSAEDHLLLKNELENENSNISVYQKDLNNVLLKIEQTQRSIARVPDT